MKAFTYFRIQAIFLPGERNKTHIGVEDRRGMLESAVMFCVLARKILNVAFISGSSKQGKARLASIAWNCVDATQLMKIMTKGVTKNKTDGI